MHHKVSESCETFKRLLYDATRQWKTLSKIKTNIQNQIQSQCEAAIREDLRVFFGKAATQSSALLLLQSFLNMFSCSPDPASPLNMLTAFVRDCGATDKKIKAISRQAVGEVENKRWGRRQQMESKGTDDNCTFHPVTSWAAHQLWHFHAAARAHGCARTCTGRVCLEKLSDRLSCWLFFWDLTD